MAQIDDIIAIKRQAEAQLLGLDGVTAVDVGYKEVGGRLTDQIAIRVHVAHKEAAVAEAQRVPAEIDGIVTDVLERTYELQIASEALDISLQADTTHYASLQGGISMGPSRAVNGYIYAGTLGAIMIDNSTHQHVALTNFHVACVDSTWHVGDRQVQPSRIDTGVPPGDEFGAILRATLSSNVDGAVISIDPTKTSTCTIAEIGNVAGTKTATLGMSVRKRGRTTGLTYGSVDGIAATVNIDYGDGLGVHTLTNQISIHPDTTKNAMFSDHGDSGSAIVDDNGYIVGLLFAGSTTSTIANQIASVLSELNLSVCVPKSVIKDVKDGHKDVIKDGAKDIKEKEKEIRKDVIKDGVKDVKDVKEKEIRKEIIKEKDLVDGPGKRIGDNLPPGPGPDPGPTFPVPNLPQPAPGSSAQDLAARLDRLEATLSQLTGFIAAEQRPDLRTGAFAGEADLTADELAALRTALEQQAADAAAAKAALDTRFA